MAEKGPGMGLPGGGLLVTDWLIDHGGWVIAAVVALAVWLSYVESQQEHMSLLKSAWQCTDKRTDYVTTFTPVGNNLMPIVSATETCVQWTAK